MLPALHVEINGNSAIIHTEVLGEYPSDVRSVELFDSKADQQIWKFVSDGEMVQIHSISLKVGENSSQPKVFWGTSRVLVPSGKPTFLLTAGTKYLVRVCSPSRLMPCNTRHFSLPSAS